MKPSRSIVAAALAVATTMGALVATPGAAQTRVVVGYRDYDGRYDRYDRRHDDRRWRGERRYRDYDRDGIPNRYDRHPYRYDRRAHARHCWTEWRHDRWRGRYAVRYCR